MNVRRAFALGLVMAAAHIASAGAQFARSDERDVADTPYELRKALEDDVEEPNDAHEVLRRYMKAAALGHAESMNRIGILYAQGFGVTQDYVAALAWYERAATLGSCAALENIATMYFYGFGVSQSYAEAAKVLKVAVRGGGADAQNKLGTLYDSGLGVEQDHPRAFKLFWQAAKQGYPPAMANLGRMYVDARGTARNDVRGYALIQAALEAGLPADMAGCGESRARGCGQPPQCEAARQGPEPGDRRRRCGLCSALILWPGPRARISGLPAAAIAELAHTTITAETALSSCRNRTNTRRPESSATDPITSATDG